MAVKTARMSGVEMAGIAAWFFKIGDGLESASFRGHFSFN
jgi:hypothetical protein